MNWESPNTYTKYGPGVEMHEMYKINNMLNYIKFLIFDHLTYKVEGS